MGSTGDIPDFDAAAERVLSPSVLAHVVLRTGNIEKMLEYYVTFLGGRVVHRDPMIAFLTYDHEHHRIALINIPSKHVLC